MSELLIKTASRHLGRGRSPRGDHVGLHGAESELGGGLGGGLGLWDSVQGKAPSSSFAHFVPAPRSFTLPTLSSEILSSLFPQESLNISTIFLQL